jgi:Plant transposon protein
MFDGSNERPRDLESMRKDVECTFGIRKGRFRILKIGIRLHSIESVDRLWKTCCALHNMLLDDDGLSTNWYTGTHSQWERGKVI